MCKVNLYINVVVDLWNDLENIFCLVTLEGIFFGVFFYIKDFDDFMGLKIGNGICVY